MPNVIRFGSFEAELNSGQLRKCGVRVRLRHQSFQVLSLLLEHSGQVITREDLRRRLWGDDVFVDVENNLNTAIAQLRKALNDSAEHPRFIETLPRHGYRFIADVYEPPPTEAEPGVGRARLVVLPFVNLSGEPAQDYLGDAMTEEMITALASLAPEQLAVIARTTSMHYKGSHKDVARIGRELNADYVVEGGIRRSRHHLGINAQLVQTSDQAHLFARKYDVLVREMFSVQSCIAREIAACIPALADRTGDKLAAPAQARQNPVEDLVALDEYIRGRNLMGRATADDLTTAQLHLEKAVARAPEFAQAFDALAEVYWYLGYFGYMRPREAFAAGIVHAARAIELDATRAETHALLGQFHKIAEYNWREVDREMALALQLGPASPTVRLRYAASALMPHGRMEEALAQIERALEFDPLSMLVRGWYGIMLVLSRHFAAGIEEARKMLDLDPASPMAYFILGAGCRYLKKFEESIAALRKSVELSGGAAFMLGWLGMTLGGSGQTAEARAVLRRLHDMATQGYVPPFSIACVHMGLKEIDAAFDWLSRAVEECDQFLMPIKSYAFLDPLRADPRYAALLGKMKLNS